jgi:hypothetical protein
MRLAFAALLLLGCTQRTQLIPGPGAPACSGTGPPIHLGSSCASAIAARSLRYALCSCAPLVLAGNLTTSSDMPPPMPPPGGPGGPGGPPIPPAAVGTDGNIQIGGLAQVAGTLEAASSSGMTFNGTASVFGNLRSGGSVSATRLLTVGADAFVAGDVLGRVDVGGTLQVAPTANLAPTVNAHDVVRAPVTVAPPCSCDATAPGALDVASLVAARRGDNDDGSIGLDPDLLAHAGPTALTLGCGAYYLSSIQATSAIDLTVHGHTALYVGGNVSLGGGLRVLLDSSAELDLLVAGNVDLGGGVLGAPDASAVRLWLASSTVRLAGGASLSAELWAPSAVLFDDSSLTMSGALLVGSVSLSGDLSIRFDGRALSGGSECGEPPPGQVE